jgi:hypothetical protein
MLLYILSWMLIGSIGMNLLWILRQSENYTMESMARGFYFGLILGPAVFIHLRLLYLKKKAEGKVCAK